MIIADTFYTFFMYLIHPLRSHDFLLGKGDDDFLPKRLSIYESLGMSWAFIVFNGLLKIWLINLVIYSFYRFTDISDGIIGQFYTGNGMIGFYFLILSTILDVIFFPLLTLIIIQFWEFIIRSYAKALGSDNNVLQKVDDIISVVLSSNALMIVPIFGGIAQKLTQIFLMYTGLRKQFDFRPAVCICIMLTPYLIIMGLLCIFLFFVLMQMN